LHVARDVVAPIDGNKGALGSFVEEGATPSDLNPLSVITLPLVVCGKKKGYVGFDQRANRNWNLRARSLQGRVEVSAKTIAHGFGAKPQFHPSSDTALELRPSGTYPRQRLDR
jgi:hypothetical protein